MNKSLSSFESVEVFSTETCNFHTLDLQHIIVNPMKLQTSGLKLITSGEKCFKDFSSISITANVTVNILFMLDECIQYLKFHVGSRDMLCPI